MTINPAIRKGRLPWCTIQAARPFASHTPPPSELTCPVLTPCAGRPLWPLWPSWLLWPCMISTSLRYAFPACITAITCVHVSHAGSIGRAALFAQAGHVNRRCRCAAAVCTVLFTPYRSRGAMTTVLVDAQPQDAKQVRLPAR